MANRLLSFSFYAFLNRICNFIEAYKHKHIVKWLIEYKRGTISFIKTAKSYKNAEKDPKSYDFRSKNGAAIQIRTGDLILTKDALYLLSYSSISDSSDIIARDIPSVNSFFQNFRLFSPPCLGMRAGWFSFRQDDAEGRAFLRFTDDLDQSVGKLDDAFDQGQA